MSVRNKLAKGFLYLQLAAAFLGCAPVSVQPFTNKPPQSKLESKLQDPSSYKVLEAKQDIEQILQRDFKQKLHPDSALVFDYMTPTKTPELYMFRYKIGNAIYVQYYCKKNNNKFERYAREISFDILADPYFLHIRFLGNKSKWVNPKEPMKAHIQKYKIEVDKGIKPEIQERNPERYLI